MAKGQIEIRPIAGALGAEIHGVDLGSDLDNETADAIHRAFLDHLVIFFRDQALTPEAHKAFARRFGALHVHPMVQGLPNNPEILRIIREPQEKENWGSFWHVDVSFQERPPLGTVLHALELPPYDADTVWSNGYLAYETLSDGLKKTLAGMRAIHTSGRGADFARAYRTRSMKARTVNAEANIESPHPVVRTHPETGRKCLFVNRTYTKRFEGWTEEESRGLLTHLFDHAERPEFTCRFRWQPNSVAFWDNRCTQHNAIHDYFPHRPEVWNCRRTMNRVSIVGDRPV